MPHELPPGRLQLNESADNECGGAPASGSSLALHAERKRDFLRTMTPALLTDGLRIEGGI
jgi:hypothetical protein